MRRHIEAQPYLDADNKEVGSTVYLVGYTMVINDGLISIIVPGAKADHINEAISKILVVQPTHAETETRN